MASPRPALLLGPFTATHARWLGEWQPRSASTTLCVQDVRQAAPYADVVSPLPRPRLARPRPNRPGADCSPWLGSPTATTPCQSPPPPLRVGWSASILTFGLKPAAASSAETLVRTKDAIRLSCSYPARRRCRHWLRPAAGWRRPNSSSPRGARLVKPGSTSLSSTTQSPSIRRGTPHIGMHWYATMSIRRAPTHVMRSVADARPRPRPPISTTAIHALGQTAGPCRRIAFIKSALHTAARSLTSSKPLELLAHCPSAHHV